MRGGINVDIYSTAVVSMHPSLEEETRNLSAAFVEGLESQGDDHYRRNLTIVCSIVLTVLALLISLSKNNTIWRPLRICSGQNNGWPHLTIRCVALIALSGVLMSAISSKESNILDSISMKNSSISKRKSESLELISMKKLERSSKVDIKNIAIVGERNSGTSWITSHMQKCFGDEVTVDHSFMRYKHWFQDDFREDLPDQTLVLAIFRNPHDWIKAMSHKPHHAPAHLFPDMDWKKFVTSPWTMERSEMDLALQNETGQVCRQHFAYNEVNSCLRFPFPKHKRDEVQTSFSSLEPFYELRRDGSGLPYDNILELRKEKILNFMTLGDFHNTYDSWNYRYEELVEEGTDGLISRIEKLTGLVRKCKAAPAHKSNRRKLTSRPLEEQLIEHINQYVDWEVEALIGYKPLPIE